MKRTELAAALLVCCIACGSPQSGDVPDATSLDAVSLDAAVPDAVPLDAPLPPILAPSLVFDDIHIAGLFEDPHAFSLLGQVLDPQLAQQIADGNLLMAIELRGLDDPDSPSDPEMTVGMYYLMDTDGDPTDNFDENAPELFSLSPGAIIMDEPAIHFTTASLANRRLHAEGVASLEAIAGGFPLPISNLVIDGRLEQSDGKILTMSDGRLRGAIGVSLLSLTPNITGDMCGGETLLDVLATGCGLFPLQPDMDVDEDGLETLFDTDNDGAVDRCVDGDGTEILGTDCPRDPAIADGYELIFVVHGVRAFILQ